MVADHSLNIELLSDGQLSFSFGKQALESAEKLRRERAAALREARAEFRRSGRCSEEHLFEIIDFPESLLTPDELAKLDAYISREKAACRSKWSLRREAQAAGKAVGYKQKLVQTITGLHPAMTIPEIQLASLEIDASELLE